METWVYDLNTEFDPVIRAGIHGLALVLGHAEGNPLFPAVHQEPGVLEWELTDTTLTVRFRDEEPLNRMMQGMFGTCPNGALLHPAREVTPGKNGYYATAQCHRGIIQVFSGGMSSTKRTKSLGEASLPDALKSYRANITVGKASGVVRKREGKEPLRYDIEITPHYPLPRIEVDGKSELVIKNHFAFQQKGKKKVSEDKGGMTGGFHPAYNEWNKRSIDAPNRIRFAVAFSPLSYVFTRWRKGAVQGKAGDKQKGCVGVSLDFETFSRAWGFHRRYGLSMHPNRTEEVFQNLFRVDADYPVAAVALLTLLEADVGRSYHVVQCPDNGKPSAHEIPFEGVDGLLLKFRQALRQEMVEGGVEFLHRIKSPWLFPQGKAQRESLFDVLWNNVGFGQPWYRGLFVRKGMPSSNLRRVMRGIVNIFGTEQHKRLHQELRNMRNLLVHAKAETRARRGDAPPIQRDWEQVDQDMVSVHFRTAHVFGDVMGALAHANDQIIRRGKRPPLSADSVMLVREMAQSDPRGTADLLSILFATETPADMERRVANRAKKNGAGVPTPVPTENTEEPSDFGFSELDPNVMEEEEEEEINA